MSVAINGTNGITFNDGTVQPSAAINKNLIINGDMRIAQRATSKTGIVAAGFYDIDRVFYTENTVGGSFDSAQSTDVPSGQGFVNSHKWSVNTTATALTTTGWAKLRHVVEGLNSAHLEWGTANAKTVTLSFWVKSSVTGTYCISINNDDFDRCYIAEYTIDTANTWEKKTITIEGDTSGTWKTDNDRGIVVSWVLDAGEDRKTTADSWQSGADFATSNQVSWISNAGATFYRTGLQLEVGTSVTDFEHLQYGQQLALCQRYYYLVDDRNGASNQVIGVGFMYDTTRARLFVTFPTTMRNLPSVDSTNIASSIEFNVNSLSIFGPSFSLPFGTAGNTIGAMVQITADSGSGTAGQARYVRYRTTYGAKLAFDAEL